MFEDRLQRKVFVPKRKKETGGYRKWLNEELPDMLSSPNDIWMIKFRKVRWVYYVICMGE